MLVSRVCFFVFVIASFNAGARAAPLPPERLATKLFHTLAKSLPTWDEIEVLRRAGERPEEFLPAYRRLIDSTLQREGYFRAVRDLHSLWWRIPTGSVALHAAYVVTNDLPYGEIYFRDYIYADNVMGRVYVALDAKVAGDFPRSPLESRAVALLPEENRFRGLFGTPEFLQVYPDTLSNLNRKRANQVFRIAFCNTVTNTLASAISTPVLTADPFAAFSSGLHRLDEHGNNPDCAGCHRRLDPMARLFDRWRPPIFDGLFAEFDGAHPAQGSVWLGGDSGGERRIPAETDVGLGAIVVAQPEFKACAASLAWRFVFGPGVPLSSADQDQLVTKFAETGRFNTLVREAVLHPYFWSDVESPAIRYSEIKPILTMCGDCHSRARATRFDPAHYPFRSDAGENAALLQGMWNAINRNPDYRPMPELPRPKLPQEHIDLIKSWIEAGAQDELGQRTVSDDQIEEVFR